MALGWHDLEAAVRAADPILCSTGAPHAVVPRELVERAIGSAGGARRRCIVDIAVPRDVEPEVAQLPGVRLYDLDDLPKSLIILGGTIAKTSNINQATLIEVIQKPLDHWGKPMTAKRTDDGQTETSFRMVDECRRR